MAKKKAERPPCGIRGCKNQSARGRAICSSHYIRQWRARNPIRYAYQALKDNAKRRRKPFSITYYDFMELIEHTAYMTHKGRRSYELHIDRIEEELGYIPGNLRVTTHSDNQDKYIIHLKKKSNDPF